MSEEMTFDFSGDAEAALGVYLQEVAGRLKQRFAEAASRTFDASQSTAPVDQGDLKASGKSEDKSTGDQIQIDVTYGDDNGYGSKYGDEDGYSWFVELGHLDRSGKLIPAQPYLGPAFDQEVQAASRDLPAILEGEL